MIKKLFEMTEKFLNWVELCRDKYETAIRISFGIMVICAYAKFFGALTLSWLLILCPLWMMLMFIALTVIAGQINIYCFDKLKEEEYVKSETK